MDQALDASAPPDVTSRLASADGEGLPTEASDGGDIDLEKMLSRGLIAAERAALAGRRGDAAALLIPVVELARALSENAAFVNQRAQLVELGDRAETLLHGDGMSLPPPNRPAPAVAATTPAVPPAPPAPPAPPLAPSAGERAAEAAELEALLQGTTDEIGRLEQARRRIAAL